MTKKYMIYGQILLIMIIIMKLKLSENMIN